MNHARRAYERLGFTLPPRGSHVEWGTGNWCVMFTKDYLELRGIIDSSRYTHHLDEFLAHREGLMGIALGTKDASASRDSLAASGLHPGVMCELSRNFELPDGWVQPRFSLCFLDDSEIPGLASVVLCQHRTPELLRRPEWLRHGNGATQIAGITVAVDSGDAILSAYGRLFGANFRATTTGGEARLGHAALRFTSLPGPDTIRIGVSDLSVTRECLNENRVAYTDGSRVVTVAPAETCGVILEFVQEVHD